MKRAQYICCWACALVSALSYGARVEIESPSGKGEFDCEIKKVSEKLSRLTVPKDSIPRDAKTVFVSIDLARGHRGEEGYIALPRGGIVDFDFPDGQAVYGFMEMPVFGAKTPRGTFWAQVRGMRNEAELMLRARDGKIEPVLRFRTDATPDGAYEDIVVDFNFLDKGAGYVEMGKAYRQSRLSAGEIKPIKERIKTSPNLEYVAKAVPVRIQFHGAKKRENRDFTPENEPPIKVRLDFKKSIDFADAFKKAGIGEVAFCSAGWQSGGYDGRFPDLFPVPEEFGGEKALREFIAHVKKIGYTIHAHTNSTDCYTCSRMWNGGEVAAKNRDGTPQRGYYWCGGKAYNLCVKHAYENYLPAQLEKVRDLGFEGPHYIDVFSATAPYMCADSKHPATRSDTARVQRDIADLCIKLFGGFSSECGFDHLAGKLDYINYVSNRIQPWYTALSGGFPKNDNRAKLARFVDRYVPLWEIVYHGIILSNPDRFTQNHTLGNAKTADSGDLNFNARDGSRDFRKTLKLAEFGGRPIFYTCNFADIPKIKQAYDEFLPLRHLQLEFMEDHKYLSPEVTETTFGNGEKTVCNYGDKPYSYNGREIPPRSYILAK